MALARYHAKRRFAKTPEPRGIEFATSQQRFVIQKHDATNLHYDLRLEHKGVMLSWAVPKGPTEDPSVRHLAAQTEDHPLEYRHFEGVIPEGYGAGTVMVWDYGTFEWIERDKSHLSFVLHGSKLKGEYVLVKFGKAGAKGWILFKKRDRFARQRSITKLRPNSAVTGRSLQEIERGAPSKAAHVSRAEGARRAVLPGSISIMKPTLIEKPFSDPEWLFESKWDGFRGVAFIEGRKLRLLSRNGLDLLDRFPELSGIAAGLAARRAVVDGEVVALGKNDLASFSGLTAANGKAKRRLVFEVFDLLYLEGFDLTHVPLLTRKGLLRAIVRPHEQLRYTDHIEGAGEQFFKETAKRKLEGMVAKELSSVYEQGKRTRTWLKIKHGNAQEFVIVGWQYGQGARRNMIGSLLLGVYEKGQLVPVGRVGSGFEDRELIDLTARLKRLTIKRPVFGVPARLRGVNFVQPKLVAQIKFAEWTPDGQLRQPVYLGLRTDKLARDVIREQPHRVELTARRQSNSAPRRHSHTKADLLVPLITNNTANQTVQVKAASLALTNLSKPFWSRPHIIKRDVINYYHQIAPIVLPHLKDRPLTQKRYPNGATGGYFYQKNVPEKHPRFVKTTLVQHSEGPTRYILCQDLPTLMWLANLADLELHPWYSRVGSLNHPDFVVFDLDPTKPNDLRSVREVALLIKDVLDHFKLKSFAKSSGSRGIHLYVPIAPKFTYDQTKAFAKRVTEIVHRAAPRQTTLEFRKAKRHGVYIDYLQNIKGKTLASAYSLRARPHASVSAPLSWHEVERGFKISDFSIATMPARVKETGDLFAETLTLKQNLGPALKKILALPV